ncbi:glycosyltransferase family 4 protein [Bacteroidota bacterium]
MKILLLIDSLGSGGRERRLIELIKGLKEQAGVDLHLVVFSSSIHYEEVYDLDIPIRILKRVPKRNPMVFYRLFKLCRDWQPDLMHSWGTMSAIWAIPTSLLLNIKLINGNITDAPEKMSFFDKRLFRARLTYTFSAAIVGNSIAGLKAYKVPEKKAVCIYNGFDTNRISNLKDKAEVKSQLGITTHRVIGMVGSFSDRKDYFNLIRSALKVLKQRRDVKFILVGDGPDLQKCMEMVPPEFTSFIKFTGIQSDVESIINVFDIGVLSTNFRKHGEGISNAILEYMALEKPTVATSGGGTDEVIDHKVTGILIPPHSPDKMTEQLTYLLDNPLLAAKMGKASKNRMETYFSLPKMTDAYLDLYNSHLIS